MKRQFRIFFNPSILFLIGLLLILPISLSVMLTAFVFANEPTDSLSNPSVARHIPAAESISLPDEQRITHYDIFVRLDEQRNMLDGSLSLLWQHPGEQPVDTLYFHLYPNAFSSENTTFMRES